MIMNIYLMNVVSDHDNDFKINCYQRVFGGSEGRARQKGENFQ